MLSADVTKVPWHARPTSEKQLRHQKEEASEFCGGQEKLTWPQLQDASLFNGNKVISKAERGGRLSKQNHTHKPELFSRRFHCNFYYKFPCICKRSCPYLIRQSSKMNWARRSGIEPRSGTFQTRPDRTWGPPSYLYNGYRVLPAGKAVGAWRWPPTPKFAPKLKKGYNYTSTPLGLHSLLQG